MKNTYQNGVLTPVNPKRYAYVYRGVLYSSLDKAYNAMNGPNGPEMWVTAMRMIENGVRRCYPGGKFIDQKIIYYVHLLNLVQRQKIRMHCKWVLLCVCVVVSESLQKSRISSVRNGN